MAGEASGRRVYAMEISLAYVDVAVELWQAETGARRCSMRMAGASPRCGRSGLTLVPLLRKHSRRMPALPLLPDVASKEPPEVRDS
jgi:hypothetical protein